MPRTLSDVRRHQQQIFGKHTDRRELIDRIEALCCRQYGAHAGNLFAIADHAVRDDVRRATVHALASHPKLKLGIDEIAQYLHTSRAVVDGYLLEAESLLAAGQTNPDRDKLLACMQLMGPALMQLA